MRWCAAPTVRRRLWLCRVHEGAGCKGDGLEARSRAGRGPLWWAYESLNAEAIEILHSHPLQQLRHSCDLDVLSAFVMRCAQHDWLYSCIWRRGSSRYCTGQISLLSVRHDPDPDDLSLWRSFLLCAVCPRAGACSSQAISSYFVGASPGPRSARSWP